MTRQQIIQDALARFPELPLRAVARFVFHNHGPAFDNNLEKIRSAIRYQVGSHGEYNRQYKHIERTKPAKMPETWRKTRVPHRLTPGLWLVMADIHIPFHEPRPLEAAMQYGKDAKVTGVLLLGDVQDCAAVSYWPSSIKRDFDREVVLFIDFLDLLRSEFPTQEIVLLPGNHEYRLPRYYESQSPELIGLPLAAMDTVLGLESRDIELLDYRQMVLAGKLPLFHGDEFRLNKSVNVARGLFLKSQIIRLVRSWASNLRA